MCMCVKSTSTHMMLAVQISLLIELAFTAINVYMLVCALGKSKLGLLELKFNIFSFDTFLSKYKYMKINS